MVLDRRGTFPARRLENQSAGKRDAAGCNGARRNSRTPTPFHDNRGCLGASFSRGWFTGAGAIRRFAWELGRIFSKARVFGVGEDGSESAEARATRRTRHSAFAARGATFLAKANGFLCSLCFSRGLGRAPGTRPGSRGC